LAWSPKTVTATGHAQTLQRKSVRTEANGNAIVVRAFGEIDFASAEQLYVELCRANAEAIQHPAPLSAAVRRTLEVAGMVQRLPFAA
jgi:hypothetical protein